MEDRTDGDGGSTPPPRMDRRRSSQVTRHHHHQLFFVERNHDVSERYLQTSFCVDKILSLVLISSVSPVFVFPDQAFCPDVRRVRRLPADGRLRPVRLLQGHEEVRGPQQNPPEVPNEAVRGPSAGESVLQCPRSPAEGSTILFPVMTRSMSFSDPSRRCFASKRRRSVRVAAGGVAYPGSGRMN